MFNNYSPKTRWISLNNNRDKVEVFIRWYPSSLRRIIIKSYLNLMRWIHFSSNMEGRGRFVPRRYYSAPWDFGSCWHGAFIKGDRSLQISARPACQRIWRVWKTDSRIAAKSWQVFFYQHGGICKAACNLLCKCPSWRKRSIHPVPRSRYSWNHFVRLHSLFPAQLPGRNGKNSVRNCWRLWRTTCTSSRQFYLYINSKVMLSRNVNKRLVYILNWAGYFVKYDILSAYVTHYWLAIVLNEYDIKSVTRKIRNMQNFGNFQISGPRIVSRNPDRTLTLIVCTNITIVNTLF